MGRHAVVVAAVVGVALLSGCALFDTAEPAFDITADGGAESIINEEYVVTTTVNNTGDAAGSTNVTVSVDGENRTREAVTLEPGDNETVTYTHTFEEAGEHTLAVGNDSWTVEVQTPLAAAGEAMGNVSTYRTETDLEVTATASEDGTFARVEANTTERAQYDREAEVAYSQSNTMSRIFLANSEEGLEDASPLTEQRQVNETWHVDGTSYSRTEENPDEEGSVTRDMGEQSFEEVDTLSDVDSLVGVLDTDKVSRERQDGAYVYAFETDDTAVAETFLERVSDGSVDLSELTVQSVAVRVEISADTYRLTAMELRFRFTSPESNAEATANATVTVSEYGEPVTVEVPEEFDE